jgi:hypothetical protein
VTTNVSVTVSSIEDQLDAIGVKYHGLRKWNTTVPKTKTSNTIAANIVYLSHPVQKMGTNAPPVRDHPSKKLTAYRILLVMCRYSLLVAVLCSRVIVVVCSVGPEKSAPNS